MTVPSGRVDRVHTLLELPIRTGSEGAVVEIFRTAGVFELAGRNEGFLGARLLVSSEQGQPLLVLAEWADETAIQRWVDDPARERANRELAPHLADEPIRRAYSVAVEWPPPEAKGGPRFSGPKEGGTA